MEMSNYCAAYEARNFRKFPGWTENAANVRKEKEEVGGKEVEVERQLDDDSILYLHESFIVTDGIYNDENVIAFDNVTDEWKSFCHEDPRLRGCRSTSRSRSPRAAETEAPAEAPPAPAQTPADTAG